MHIESKSSALFQPPVHCIIPLLYFTKKQTQKKYTCSSSKRGKQTNKHQKQKKGEGPCEVMCYSGGVTNALWNTEDVPDVPAMISGPRGSSMVSTSGMGVGWGSESSESTTTEEEAAPASSAPAPSIPSTHTGDNSSPANRLQHLNIKHRHIKHEWQSVDLWEHLFKPKTHTCKDVLQHAGERVLGPGSTPWDVAAVKVRSHQ